MAKLQTHKHYGADSDKSCLIVLCETYSRQANSANRCRCCDDDEDDDAALDNANGNDVSAMKVDGLLDDDDDDDEDSSRSMSSSMPIDEDDDDDSDNVEASEDADCDGLFHCNTASSLFAIN